MSRLHRINNNNIPDIFEAQILKSSMRLTNNKTVKKKKLKGGGGGGGSKSEKLNNAVIITNMNN